MERSTRFATVLKELRRAAGLTQEELAERAGVSPRAISALERGINHAPRKATLAAIAGALPLTPTERAALQTAAHAGAHLPASSYPVPPTPGDSSRSAPSTPPFVRRANELDQLGRQLLGDGPPIAFVVGEPGIGKSRLLHELGRRAHAQGVRVVLGRGQRQGGQDPYSPLLEAIAACIESLTARERAEYLADAGWLARLLPELAHSGVLPEPPHALAPAQERRLIFQSVGRLCTRVAAVHGLLILLDDVHWASQDALDLLVALAPAFTHARVCVVAAYRETELDALAPLLDALADLASNDLATSLTLAPLLPREAEELIAALVPGTPVPDQSASLLRRTGGVPFYLVHCALEGASNAVDHAVPGSLPWSITWSVRQRVARLPTTARELLRCIALADIPCSLPLLHSLAQRLYLPAESVSPAVDAAIRAGLLVESSAHAYQFAHDLLREVVEAEVGPVANVELHGAIAEALEGTAEPAMTTAVAYQYIRGGQWERAATHLERAADRAQDARAFAEAASLYAELAGGLDSLGHASWAATVREKLAATLMNLARYDDALTALRIALAWYRAQRDALGIVRALARAGETHVMRGTPHEGLTLLRTELPVLADAPPSPGSATVYLAPAYLAYAWLLNACSQYADALPVATHAAQLARARDDTATAIQADLRRSQLLLMLGQLDDGAAVLRAVIPLAEAAGDLRSLRLALNSLGWVHEARGEFAQDERYTEQAFAVAQRLGDPSVLAFMTSNRGGPAYNLGKWRQAREAFEAGLALMRPLGPTWASAWPPLLLGRLELAQGAVEIAETLLTEAIATATQSGDLQALRWAHAALAERDLLLYAPAAARDRLTPLLDRADQQESDVCPLLPLLAWAHLALGDMARAEDYIAQAVARAGAADMRPTLVSAWRVRALLWQQREQWDRAAADLRAALAVSRRTHHRYAEALLRYECARLALRRKQPERARTELDAASRMLAALGERLYLTQVEHLQRELPPAAAPHRLAGTQPSRW